MNFKLCAETTWKVFVLLLKEKWLTIMVGITESTVVTRDTFEDIYGKTIGKKFVISMRNQCRTRIIE